MVTRLSSPGRWLAVRSAQTPRAPALSGIGSLDYAQLAKTAAGLSTQLAEQGVVQGQVVAVQSGQAAVLASMLYAALYRGFTLLPLDPGLSPDRREKLLAACGCNLLVSHQAPSGTALKWLAVDVLFPLQAKDGFKAVQVASPVPATPLQGEAVQLIIATSGTTGDPKGVMLSAANLAASVAASEQRLGLTAGDSWLACLPLSHIGGLSILLRCLAAGARVLLPGGFDAERVWRQIADGSVTHLSLVPAMLDRLLAQSAGQPPPATLRVVLIGGGPLSGALAERAHAAGWSLCVSYGMSETASQFATDCSPRAGLESGQVGRPLDGYEVALGESGRIRVRGPAVMRGYANTQGEAGIGLERGWFETGDLGRIDEQGCLTVIGRADDLLVSGGKTIHPAEVEERLLRCPGVIGVGVTGRQDPVWGDTLVALFVGDIEAEALAEWSRLHLPGALRPRQFLAVCALPLNAMGKLSRPALRDLLSTLGNS
ncbi:class I adenylate-forming enzyme family protein [Sedimenticola sp.]|uniref:class I adenylate-forming enzyme family protein n=1 Tax=Sedimenticola sp. TaxID=1940285 RepID=UPI003D11C8A3